MQRISQKISGFSPSLNLGIQIIINRALKIKREEI